MKLPVTFATAVSTASFAALLSMSACDDKGKDEAKRPDLAPAADAKAGADAKADAKAPVADGRVFFVKPADGATVSEQFEVEFGVEGKQVRPAGATERDPGFGHHHLIVDGKPIPDMTVVPKDETHIHYGDGSIKATVELSPGKHQLTMQFADGAHRSYGESWSATISVEVQAGAGDEAPVADEAGEAG